MCNQNGQVLLHPCHAFAAQRLLSVSVPIGGSFGLGTITIVHFENFSRLRMMSIRCTFVFLVFLYDLEPVAGKASILGKPSLANVAAIHLTNFQINAPSFSCPTFVLAIHLDECFSVADIDKLKPHFISWAVAIINVHLVLVAITLSLPVPTEGSGITVSDTPFTFKVLLLPKISWLPIHLQLESPAWYRAWSKGWKGCWWTTWSGSGLSFRINADVCAVSQRPKAAWYDFVFVSLPTDQLLFTVGISITERYKRCEKSLWIIQVVDCELIWQVGRTSRLRNFAKENWNHHCRQFELQFWDCT